MNNEVSVIIPCLNEINTIGKTISAASDELSKAGISFEIIVIDNGSTDGSDEVIKSYKTKYILSDAYPVAAIRNIGVEMSNGDILVFLDADIVVQPFWGQALKSVCLKMLENDNFITGSQPEVPDNIQPILYSWYKAISEDKRDTHLGTGHMIVSKNAFENIGGFDQSLVTNEDYYFCYKAKKMGYGVISNPEMKVFHFGYPNNLIDFAKREIWHGSGYCNNFKLFFRSRIAWCGSIFLLLNLVMLLSFFINYKLFIIMFIITILTASLFNIFKFGYGDIKNFIYRSIISYVYFLSRGLSMPMYLFKKNKFNHWLYNK